MKAQIKDSFDLLKGALEAIPLEERFMGYDPFDALNSAVIKNTLLGKIRLVRLAWVQFFKRSPLNFRRLTGIKKDENPQALAVFLSAYCKLYQIDKKEDDIKTIYFLANRLLELKLKEWSGACWGYPFAWQARAFYQPENTPLIIPTAYCFNALLDAFEITKKEEYKTVALSSAEFVISDLNRSHKGTTFAFSYSPTDDSVVYNASLMASQVLARSYSYTTNEIYKNTALASVEYCINEQKDNGSWVYGKQPFHQWIDNFHSGYNLVCLMDYATYCNDNQFDKPIAKGLGYYLKTFFEKDGFSKYYSNQKFPLDINNTAQLIITLAKANKIAQYQELINTVVNYTISKLQSKNGWFFYQKNKWFTNKIIYLRWSNSWMFYAFTLLSKNAGT